MIITTLLIICCSITDFYYDYHLLLPLYFVYNFSGFSFVNNSRHDLSALRYSSLVAFIIITTIFVLFSSFY